MGGRQKSENKEKITISGNMDQTTEERLKQVGKNIDCKSMAQSFEENLLQVIKKDDIKAFNALMEKSQCGAYRLGRFPVLSLMYLYKSKKILSAYEEMFLGLTNFRVLSEPLEVSNKFSAKAGKCLRLYLNEVVSPIEMLLILNNTKRLRRVYPKTNPSPTVKGRLKSIYYIKYSLNVRFEGNDIILDRRPLSYSEKKRIATVCLCLILAITIVVGVPVTVVSLIPKPIEGEVTTLSDIDFASQNTYTLKKDITLPENYSIDSMNCTIIGKGHKLIFGKGATIGQLNGKLSDLKIDSSGDALFTVVSQIAVIENVTLNVNADIETKKETAFVALTNYGTIENVTLNVKGKIKALATSAEGADELVFGGIVLQNLNRNQTIGTIKNCKVNYSQFTLVGEVSANAVFGGVAGVNYGYLQDCKVTGEIIADTFDIAGVSYFNIGVLSGDINEAKLSQTSSDTGWNPIVCGIVLENYLAVEKCQNLGNISAISACDQSVAQEDKMPAVSASGIVYLNNVALTSQGLFRGEILSCKNSGAITAIGKGDAYVGGIASHAYFSISNCLSSGDITVEARGIYAGGILGSCEVKSIFRWGDCFGVVDSCISACKMDFKQMGDTPAFVGGITGYVQELEFNSNDSVEYFGGCVTNSFFIGGCISEDSYFGNIIGGCGANIYQNNSYTTSDGKNHNNFEGNYYVKNNFSAFGATVTDDKEFANVEDKGATSDTLENIQNLKGYKDILNSLSSK